MVNVSVSGDTDGQNDVSVVDLPSQNSDVVPDEGLAGETAPVSGVDASPKVNSLRAITQSVAFRFFIVVANAATGILTARSLKPQGRGELAALLLWPQVLAGAAALGLPNALTYFTTKHAYKRAKYISSGFYLAAICTLVATAFGILVVPFILAKQYSPEILFWAKLLMPTVVFSLLAAFARNILEARGEFFLSNGILSSFSAAALAGLLGLLAFHRLNTISAGIVYSLSGMPAILMVVARGWRFRWWSPREVVPEARELLSYGLRSYGGDLCGILTLYIDQALVIALLTPALMGAYVVALNLSRIVNIVQQSVCVVLFPKSVGQSPEMVLSINRRALHASLMISLLCWAGISLFGAALLHLLYGREYMAAVGVFRILLFEVVINGIVAVCAQAFMALNRPGTVTIQQIAGLMLAIPLLMALIPRYGLIGAGGAILLATMVRMIVIMISFPMILKLPMPALFPNREEWRWFYQRARNRTQ